MKSNIYNCSVLELPKIEERAGNITPINSGIELPFNIKRVYYLYDVPGGEIRGGHAHYELEQLLIAVSGSFDITLYDGLNRKTVSLNRPNYGLHIVPGIWRDISNFSSGAVLLVLASLPYDEGDYIRDYSEYIKFVSTK